MLEQESEIITNLLLSTVQNMSFTYCLSYMSILHGSIMNSQNDWLPVGLIAQLVKHCTCITEIMGSIPVQAWIFSALFFATAQALITV